MRIVVAMFDLLTALTMIPRRRLNRRARRYKLSVAMLGLLLVVACLDRTFVLPRYDGWIGLGALLLAVSLFFSMAWRWLANENLDVPRRWRAHPND